MSTHKVIAFETHVSDSSGRGGENRRSVLLPTLMIVAVLVLLHLLTNGRYGFNRDELQFMSDSLHLDWGFVQYPPLAPFLARISISVFGHSLAGLRLFPLIAHASAWLLTALMAKEFGGQRLALAAATVAIALSPDALYESSVFQYTSFDYLWWVLICYFMLRMLKSDNSRWWLAIGAVEGLGLMTKYSIVFLIAGMLCGLLFTQARRYFTNRWFWIGNALALLICLPNIVWQIRHDFVSYDFLRFLHSRDVKIGLTNAFLSEQPTISINVFSVPICIAGLIGLLCSRRFRPLAWLFLTPLVLFAMIGARSYYLAPVYPVLIAMGTVMGERWIFPLPAEPVPTKHSRRKETKNPSRMLWLSGRRWAGAVLLAAIVLWGAWSCVLVLPLQAKGPIRDFALGRNSLLRDQFGWPDLVQTTASIRDSLPPDQRSHLGIVVGNYGEQGAIEILGPAYRLPLPVSAINTAWLRGYPSPPPTTLIVMGFQDGEVELHFNGCKVAALNGNSEHVRGDEFENYPHIFLCGSPRLPWSEYWKQARNFQ